MLTGLDRGWFEIYADARFIMELSLNERSYIRGKKGNFGILVDDDYWALKYQIYHYRARRAKHSLLRPGVKWYEYKNDEFDDNETAKKKGEEIDRQWMREDWERYMYAKKKIKEDFSHMFEE
ncbi:MAG: hypothetical protein ACOCT9_02815 [archaeon]